MLYKVDYILEILVMSQNVIVLHARCPMSLGSLLKADLNLKPEVTLLPPASVINVMFLCFRFCLLVCPSVPPSVCLSVFRYATPQVISVSMFFREKT